MTTHYGVGAAQVLARRLRDLRISLWPDLMVTQENLAVALSSRRRVTAPSISSWERDSDPVVPPGERLSAYATFFATRRSLSEGRPRLLDAADLVPDERVRREQLERELLDLRDAALAQAAVSPAAGPDPWRFIDGEPITIICGEVSEQQRELQTQASPEHLTLAYGEMYSYADVDALYELHGQLRASNPRSNVRTVPWRDVDSEALIGHVVIVGRGDRGETWRDVEESVQMPVSFGNLEADVTKHYIEVEGGGRFSVQLDDGGGLSADVGLFYRGPNPFADQYTLTICHGMFSVGTLNVVRSLSDEYLGPDNVAYLDVERSNQRSCLFLLQINVVGQVQTIPRWRSASLFEWRGDK
jgi:hypothetical protein